ncbi:hypothetical protein EHEL_101690 [Encephalitozoon hellem ATCC 50504]|uniref:Uncharacterized protein n=1 Tax=Encephalitozoon hellem TaxID=27973 RepID=A0A9Q9C4Z3_ENCHE|nr:uncharacterized protein EHEL_101690 [Encephalitozoon hellem ATCC 50504]AFM99261.1 hypothetical protein EHEL_101690 [Encephalitozoon hellem ATCC 50504]UTX44249.1 hypothetical protein GPU96_10g20410 [Encephalitozoon hellem]|eukprot:XP_003888242.1 hypothetical protein EHEL_101690 [Encephalitozoon hellem ATCC 50504]
MEGSRIKEAVDTNFRDFSSRIDRLDMGNPEHVVWAYKNIRQAYSHSATDFSRMVKMMAEHRPLDFNTSLIVLEEIGGILHKHFGEEEDDEEISFVASKCGLSITSGESDTCMRYVDYLYRLVLPFAKVCTKQVVDIVAFLFTRTSTAEFDELFEIFGKKKDFLVELYLLKVKLMRERSAKYKCERCRNADKKASLDMEECIKNMKISPSGGEMEKDPEKKTDFYSIEDVDSIRKESNEKFPEDLSFSQGKPFFESGVESHSLEGGKSLNGSEDRSADGGVLEGKPHLTSDGGSRNTSCECGTDGRPNETCLCASYKPSDEAYCLSEAKKHLLDIESISPRFFLENVALYLSLSFDKELLDLFRKYVNTEYGTVCAFHVFKLKTIDRETSEALIGEMKDAKREILKSENLAVTSTTFNLYVEWCMDTFGSISISSINDYSDISRLYVKFLRAFPHKKMFLILEGMCESRIDRVSNVVYGRIACDLEEIVSIILGLFGDTNEDDRRKASNTLMDDEKIFRNSSRLDAPNFCIKQELEKIVFEVCKRYRKAFLSQIKVLLHFPDDFRLKIVSILCGDYDNDWRYRRALLHSYREHPHFFEGIFNLDIFTRDPVFIVRRTALDIREELGIESTKPSSGQSL